MSISLENFMNLYKDILPDDTMEACYGVPEDALLIPDYANPKMWTHKSMKRWFLL